MGQINTNNYPTVNSLLDADLLIVENATHGTGTTTPKQLRENAIGTDTLHTSAQSVTGAINELKGEIDAGAGVVCYDVDTITSGYLGGQFNGSANLLLLHLTADGTADATNGYMLMLSYTRPVARFAYGRLVDSDGVAYKQDVYADNTIICKISDSGTGTESDPKLVVILGIINAGFILTPTAVVSDRDIIDGQGNTLSVLAEALTKTASGNPVVITDCAGGKARSLITEIEPIQDLHGLPFPYVGGAYKNLVELYMTSREVNGVTYTKNSDGSFTLNGTATGNINFRIDQDNTGSVVNPKTWAAGTYAMSKSTTKFRLVVMQDSTFTTIMSLEANDTSGTVTLADTVNNCFTFIAINSGTRFDNEKFYIQIEKGNQATAWTPWENICPISGRDSVAVERTGQNLWDEDYAGIAQSIKYTPVYVGDGSFTLRTTAPRWDNSGCAVFLLAGNVSSGATNADHGAYNGSPRTQTAVNGYVTVAYRIVGDIDPRNYDTELIKTSEITNATIQLGQTVYGADINWDTGVMTVKTACETFDNTTDWPEPSDRGSFAKQLLSNDAKAHSESSTFEGISNCLVGASGNGIYNGTVGINCNGRWLGIRIAGVTTRAELIAFTTATPIQVEYPLATPTTIQLTPEQLQMLKGYNRVTIDNGSIEVGYIAKLT